MTSDLIITGKYVLSGEKIMHDGAVAVTGGLITGVFPEKEIKDYPAREIIACGNSIVMPGLVNTHTHAAMAYFRGAADDMPLGEWLNDRIWPAEKRHVNPEFAKRSSELACLEMIKAGITCFADMYFFPSETAGVCSRAGIRAFLGEPLLSFPMPGCESYRQALIKTAELAEECEDRGLVSVIVNPHSVYAASEEILVAARSLADRLKLPIAMHLAETEEEERAVRERTGMSSVKYLDSLSFLDGGLLAAHCVFVDGDDIAILKEKNIDVSHNPSSNLKLASGIMPACELMEAGINICLGTDGPASNNTLDLFSDMRIAAMVHKSARKNAGIMAAREIVCMATSNGAAALKTGAGVLESGRKADIITVNLDKPHLTPIYDPYSHLVYCAFPSDVENSVVDGKVVMRKRKVLTMDEERILREARLFALNNRV